MRRLVVAGVCVAAAAVPALAVPAAGQPRPVLPAELPLGRPGLAEQRTTTELAPGVVLHEVVRGASDPDDFSTATAGFAPTEDAAAALSDRVRAAGLAPRVERAGTAGWVVRVGRFGTSAAADPTLVTLRAAGLSPRVDNTVDDGLATDGPYRVNIVVVDPRRFTGSLDAALATDDVHAREKTSDLARRKGAIAAVNGGYFTIDGTRDIPGPWLEGTDGDPAGISAIDGELLSEAVNDRGALLLHAGRADVRRLRTDIELRSGDARRVVTGLNRVPGLVVNCGGVGAASPSTAPAHDYTCGNADELVVFTPRYGTDLPAGPGVQVTVDARGRVTTVQDSRGGPEPLTGQVIQATGAEAAWLRAHATPGAPLTVRSTVTDTDTGQRVPLTRSTSVVNGGPVLVHGGDLALDPAREGWSPEPIAGAPRAEFFWRWYERRNPRTAAGVLPDGRVVLVQSDGRAPGWSAGLSIQETAVLLESLGAEEAVNLDGGGSSAVVAHGRLVNRPSDAAGERPTGDAILLTP